MLSLPERIATLIVTHQRCPMPRVLQSDTPSTCGGNRDLLGTCRRTRNRSSNQVHNRNVQRMAAMKALVYPQTGREVKRRICAPTRRNGAQARILPLVGCNGRDAD